MTDKKPTPKYKTTKTTAASKHKVVVKTASKMDIVTPGKPLPSASSRPIIVSHTPSQVDTTLKGPKLPDLTKTPKPAAGAAKPLISKRTMIMEPSATLAASGQAQPAGFEFSKHDDKPKISGRPARPLMSKPVATGPTIAELLKAKQQTSKPLAEAPQTEVADKPVPVAKAEPKLVAKAAEKSKAVVAPLVVPEPPKPAAAKAEPTEPVKTVGKTIAPPDGPKPAPAAPADETPKTETDAALPDAAVASKLGTDKPIEQEDPLAERPQPQLYGGKSVIVIHESHPVRSFFSGMLVAIALLAVIATAANFLLDAEVISINYDIPHTDML